ncbi:MAG: hypothetical protein AAF485_10130 [Chloroflexota bacterium]
MATDKPKETKVKEEGEQPKRYFIVNPAGAVHEVTAEHMKARLKDGRYRAAKPAEVEQYLNREVQRADDPIASPHTTDPDEAMEAAAKDK